MDKLFDFDSLMEEFLKRSFRRRPLWKRPAFSIALAGGGPAFAATVVWGVSGLTVGIVVGWIGMLIVGALEAGREARCRFENGFLDSIRASPLSLESIRKQVIEALSGELDGGVLISHGVMFFCLALATGPHMNSIFDVILTICLTIIPGGILFITASMTRRALVKHQVPLVFVARKIISYEQI